MFTFTKDQDMITFPEATTSILLDSAADPNVSAFCYFLVCSGPFMWDLSLMKIMDP